MEEEANPQDEQGEMRGCKSPLREALGGRGAGGQNSKRSFIERKLSGWCPEHVMRASK